MNNKPGPVDIFTWTLNEGTVYFDRQKDDSSVRWATGSAAYLWILQQIWSVWNLTFDMDVLQLIKEILMYKTREYT